jgi:hypothetical protein
VAHPFASWVHGDVRVVRVLRVVRPSLCVSVCVVLSADPGFTDASLRLTGEDVFGALILFKRWERCCHACGSYIF